MIGRPLRHVTGDSFFAERMLLGDDDVRNRRAPTRSEIKFHPASSADMYMHVSKTTIFGPNADGSEGTDGPDGYNAAS